MARKPRKQTFPEGVALSTVRGQQGFREGQDPRGWILFASEIRADPDERTLSGMGRQEAAQRWTKNERAVRPQTQQNRARRTHSPVEGGRRGRKGKKQAGPREAVLLKMGWTEADVQAARKLGGDGKEGERGREGPSPCCSSPETREKAAGSAHRHAQFWLQVREVIYSSRLPSTCWVPSDPPNHPGS